MTSAQPENLRRLPAQDRSTQRIELILDTAARLFDDIGPAMLTPALIAREASMSGPAIYRYFADLDAIMRALATRIVERIRSETIILLRDDSIDWQHAVAGSVDIYARLSRTEPGFRVLRLDAATQGIVMGNESASAVIARTVVPLFRERFDAWDRPQFLEHIEALIEIANALVLHAFESPTPEFFLAEAKRVTVHYLGDFLDTVQGTPPAPSAVGAS